MRKFSLHVGLNKISNAHYGNGWNGNLIAAVPDAIALSSTFAQAGFTARTLLDSQASLAAAIGELTMAADETVAGDVFIWTYSGHGAQNDDGEAFCLYDGELGDAMLHNLRARFHPEVRVVSIWDTCFSGGLPNVTGRSRRRPDDAQAYRGTRERATNSIVCPELILAASKTTEDAAEDAKHGYFTGALLDTIDSSQTWSRWFDRASAMTTSRNAAQHPVAYQQGPQTIFPAQSFTFTLSTSPVIPPEGMPGDPGPSQPG